MKNLVYCVVLLHLVFVQSVWAQGRAAAVGVQAVEPRVLSETVPVFAEVVTIRDGFVAGRIAGNVETVHVLAGQKVEEGDLLVELNTELLSIRVNQSEAAIAEARAATTTMQSKLDRAKTGFDRVEALRGTAAFSEGRFDDVQADLLEAQSGLAEANAREISAEARLAESRYQLARSEIRAPFSGTVLEVSTIAGAFIQAGTPVVRMVDTAGVEVRADVPARNVSFLNPGDRVQGRTETGTELDLVLRALLPEEDTSTRTRAVLFSLSETEDTALAAIGQSITVNVPVGEAREVLSVPKDALVQARGGWTVFVAAEDKAQPRNVTLGAPLGDRYEVVDGLQAGDLVVVRGNERLRPGQDIMASVLETN